MVKLDLHDDSWKNLWRNSSNASAEERWKWDEDTWKPVLEKIWAGDVDHLICPVCGQECVYFKYLAVHEIEVKGEKWILADRWIGCENCGVQIHDRVRVPNWLKDPEWSPGAEKWRERFNKTPDA